MRRTDACQVGRQPLLDEHLFAPLADRRQYRNHQQDRGDRSSTADKRAVDEHIKSPREISRAPAQLLLHQRPEHEAEQHRRRLEAELDQHVADSAEERRSDSTSAGALLTE